MRAPAQTKAVEVSVMLTGDDVTALRFNVGLCFSQNTEYEGVNELRKMEAQSDFEADDFLAPYSN